jgi:cadmium resistance transport/sequestration family protein
MSWFAKSAIAGITSFAATNIDDIAILMLFFAQNATFRPKHIVVGQYLGFTALILISLPGFFGGLILPRYWIGLLGLIPIAIGLSNLLNWEDASEDIEAETELYEDAIASFLSPQAYAVAAITVANGGDNIGIYVPLFANSNLGGLVVIICIFLLLVGVWCYAAYKLTQQGAIAEVLTRYVNYLVPVVLIGIGTFIVLESSALSLLKLVASCLCLMVLVRKDRQSPEVTKT